ncbi:MAG: hypothetical protein FWD16_00425 [Clostridia bacterium]|nr:hypothetical protein [Clostridia bacterium]
MGTLNETPFEEELRLLNAIGWDAKYITIHRDKGGNPLNVDDEQIQRDFRDAIDKGYPVLTRYLHAGHRYNIIIGYEDDGNKIISKDAIETTGVHTDSETNVREKWQRTIAEYILLKEKIQLAPERERALELFKMITTRARRTDKINGMKTGFAAWESYLDLLEHDDFAGLSVEDIGERMSIYCDGLCGIWGRNAALPYYRALAERMPEWRQELEAAVAALDACANYGGFLWSIGFSMDDFKTGKFADPTLRKILADEGRRAMRKDIEAVAEFEKILKKEGMQACRKP